MAIDVLPFQKPVVGDNFSSFSVPETRYIDENKEIIYDKEKNTVYLRGIFEKPGGAFGIGKQVYQEDKPLIIDGQGETYFWSPISIMDCHNVILKNFSMENAFIELNDSYPEIGLKNITLDHISVYGGTPRGIFMGGHNIHGITLRHCTVLYTIFGTHCVYLTGGHWNENWPPVSGILVEHCDFGYALGGRNTFQINGRVENVVVRKNRFRHAQIGGCTFIGVQNGTFEENVSYGHNRGTGFQSYVYASHWAPYYNNFATQEDIDLFCMTHWPNQNLLIKNNTLVVGPHQVSYDDWHNDDPKNGHPAALVNNAVHEDYFPFPTKNIVFKDNILVSESDHILDIYTKHDAENTHIIGNMAFTHSTKIPFINFAEHLKEFHHNVYKDPYFQHGPVYPPAIKLEEGYDWSKHKSVFNPFSYYGWKNHKGVTFKMPVLGNDVAVVND